MTRDSGSRRNGENSRSEVERWQPVAGYETLYAVSDHGRVRSVRNGRVIANLRVTDGYFGVKLHRAGQAKNALVHRLVCQAFCGAAGDGQQVAHLDGDRQNNHYSNLAWVSPRENTGHKRLHGTHQAGEMHPRAKLTATTVAAIRESDETHAALAREHGVDERTIRDIRTGRRWKELQSHD
jgi:hypothetical protein